MRDTCFRDRTQAGRILATQLAVYANRRDVLVLALPRGGIPVGVEVVRALHAPLDVLLVRKLGVPGEEELAMGAIATGGIRMLNEEVVRGLGISDEVIDKAAAREQRELERREHLYRGNRPAYEEFAAQGVEVVCVIKPEPFYGVGLWYERFPQLSDEAVCDLLARAWHEEAIPPGEEHREQSTINAGSGKQ